MSVAGLEAAVEEICGITESDFLIAPQTQSFDLFFRGGKVSSTLAVVPRALKQRCVVFQDAGDFAVPVMAPVLLPLLISVDSILHIAGGSKPVGLNIICMGAALLDPEPVLGQHTRRPLE